MSILCALILVQTSSPFAVFDPIHLSKESYVRTERFTLGEGESELLEFRGTLRLAGKEGQGFILIREERLIRHEIDGQPLPVPQDAKPAEWKERWASNGQGDPLTLKEDLAIGRMRRATWLQVLPLQTHAKIELKLKPHETNLYPGANWSIECVGVPSQNVRRYRLVLREVGSGASLTSIGVLNVDTQSWAILQGEWILSGVPMPGNPELKVDAKITITQEKTKN